MTLRNGSGGAGRMAGFPGACAAWEPAFGLDDAHDLAFDEAIERVEAALRLGIDPSLEPVRALLAELGHPERAFASVQVAGTNGKTSTSRYAAALLAGEGLRCGLYTSPHLVDYTERVEVAGAPVSRAVFAHGVSWALAAWERICARGDDVAAQGCTEFELLTAAAMVVFAEQGVELAVLEVGLGGRWDATSAVPTVACAITGIGLDHTHILGDTLEKIAAEKAAVIRSGNPCILGTNAVRPAGVLAVMLERCAVQDVVPTQVVEVDADAVLDIPTHVGDALPRACFALRHRPERLGDELVVDVACTVFPDGAGAQRTTAFYPEVRLAAPAYQAQNVACALALATAVRGRALDLQAARASVAACAVPGRFEVVRREPLALLDACHNPQSAEAFAQAVRDAEPDRAQRPTLLVGALGDKDHEGIVRIVAPLFDRIVVTQSASGRAFGAHELACEIEETGAVVEAVFEGVERALAYLEGRPFVCCGTITLIGEVASLLRQG